MNRVWVQKEERVSDMKGMTALVMAALLAVTAASVRGQGDEQMNVSTIRSTVNTVRIRVTASDALNRFITGFKPEHFKVYEDKVEQTIANFTQESSPVSIGLVFDSSSSMKDKTPRARKSATEFLNGGSPEDEFFLVLFSSRARLANDITHDIREIQNKIAMKEPHGSTALLDAIYIGLEKIQECTHPKKALIVITDGEDNNSRYTFAEVQEFAREVDCQVYVIGEHGRLGYGEGLMQDLAKMSGGRVFFPNSLNELDYYIDLIHAELRHQYILGYVSSNKRRDGTWRKITVKLEPPPGMPRVFLQFREGYYAPKQ